MLAVGLEGQSWAEAFVRILIVLAITGAVLLVLRQGVRGLVRTGLVSDGAELEQRVHGLTEVLFRTALIIALAIAGLIVLSHAGFDITPVLAGAGVVGLAVGLGAQTLFRDTLNGFFIVLENQYGKGDVVTIAGLQGRVEDVNLRRTVLRGMDGTLHSVPNSQITTASNHTRQWSRVQLDLTFGLGEDPERLIGIIDRVGQELAADPAFAERITSAPRAVWVEGLGGGSLQLKILGDTQAGAQWEVASELRRRLQKAFLAEKVEVV